MTQQSPRNPNDFLARQRKTARVLTFLAAVVVVAIAIFAFAVLTGRISILPASIVSPAATLQLPQTVVTTVAQTVVIAPPTVVIVAPTVSVNATELPIQSTTAPAQPTETAETPNAATGIYLEPKVLEPSPGQKFSQLDQIRFSWVPVGTLRPTDLYRVQVASDPSITTIVCEIHTRDNNAILSQNTCNSGFKFNNLYYWHIQVVMRDPSGSEKVESPQGIIYQFGWQP